MNLTWIFDNSGTTDLAQTLNINPQLLKLPSKDVQSTTTTEPSIVTGCHNAQHT